MRDATTYKDLSGASTAHHPWSVWDVEGMDLEWVGRFAPIELELDS